MNFCCGRSIWTTMQNLEILARKLSELWSFLCFGGHFVFGCYLVFWQNKKKCRVSIWTSMQNLRLWAWKLSDLWSILCFGGHLVLGIFFWSIWTSMQNFWLLAWKLSELWSILCFGGHFVLGGQLLQSAQMRRWLSEWVSYYSRYRADFAAKN